MITSAQRKPKLSSYKGKNNYHMTYSITDFAVMYEKETGISQKLFKQVLGEFLKELRDTIIKKRYKFQMPHRLGYLRIVKRKNNTDNLKIDYKKTKELGETIYHLNRHTDRHFFRWIWNKPKQLVTFKNNTFYSFNPVRSSKRALSHYIFECANDPYTKDYDCLS